MTQANPGVEAFVLDASVAVIWHLPNEPHTAQAERVLDLFQAGSIALSAPTHIIYEVSSAITVATRGRQARLTSEEGRAAVDRFLRLGVRTLNGSELAREAYEFALESGVAFYDALYGALSRRLGIPLVVADRPFYLRARSHIDAIWIGNFRSIV